MIRRFARSLPCHPDADPFAPLRIGSARRNGAIAPFGIRLFTVCLFLLTACASPEAVRTRGDGPGADVGNRRKPAQIHAGAKPYYESPCATDSVECNGPLPVFGSTPPPD
jgi:hypothetical protein